MHSIDSHDSFYIVTDKNLLQMDVIVRFICQESYWGKEMTPDLVIKSIENSSLCFGLFEGNPYKDPTAKQIGFARVISDFVRFAYLADVFILKEYRGKGLSKWLMETIVNNPKLKGAAFHLTTKDAHTLYEKFGFQVIHQPENRLMRPLDMKQIYKAYKQAIDN